MKTARFTVSSIVEERNARDLQNVLLSIAGVARIEVNRQGTPTFTVAYDPSYAGEETLQQVIQRSGYPVEMA